MANDMKPPGRNDSLSATPTLAQREVHRFLEARCLRFLNSVLDQSVDGKLALEGAFQSFERPPEGRYPRLSASRVDLPPVAATCDPQQLIEAADYLDLLDPDSLFSSGVIERSQFRRPTGANRREYLKLVVQQLLCGKTTLRTQVKAVGDVFTVGKADGRQREVWNGGAISAACLEPPPPPLLANPSCFVDLQFRASERTYMSKRDVHTCFDVLQAPNVLQPWFGRPPVRLAELVTVSGLDEEMFRRLTVDAAGGDVEQATELYPCSAVWPMGFSWSSYIAQGCTVACCRLAGVPDEAFMTLDRPPPLPGDEACGVATDDTFFFHTDRELGTSRLEALDAAFVANGMPKNLGKDVTLADSMVALGCEISSSPPSVEPAAGKHAYLFTAWLDLIRIRRASPAALNRALGVEQWFCLLARPMFSVFQAVYEFVRREPTNVVVDLPPSVVTELVVALFLMPLQGADPSREFLPLITASDAAPEFGFGVSYLPCPIDLVEKVGSLAERRGDFVKFFPVPGAPPPKDRLGNPHLLPFPQHAFHDAICAKARWQAHSSVLEAHGLLLAVKWLLRKPAHFHHRMVVLVDAKAILGAVAKGRSSAPAIRGILRRIAVLLLCTGSLLRLIYVPSEHNAADAPSRGRRRRHRRRVKQQKLRTRAGTVTERRRLKDEAAYAGLVEIWGPDL